MTPDRRQGTLASVENKVLAGFALALALLLFGALYTYRTGVKLTDSIEWVAHTQEVRATLADLYGSLTGADLAEREYFRSSAVARRDEYTKLNQRVRGQLNELSTLTRDNRLQADNIAALHTEITTHLDYMAAALVAFGTYGAPAARAVLTLGRRNGDDQGLRALIERMDAIEARLLSQRELDAVAARETTLVSLLATFAVATGLFIGLFREVRTEMRGRREADRSLSREVAEVKAAESQLRTANKFLDSLVESLPVMIFVKDAVDFRYVRQNRATLELLGLQPEDVLGKRDRDFLPAEQADFIESKDREVLATGQPVDIAEQSINTRVGLRTLHTVKMPILDEQGKPQFLLGISEDITERKLSEHAIRELNMVLMDKAEQLEASNKELESFSYSVSHDLRAPLRAIDGFALMMIEDYAEKLDSEGMRYLDVIRENSRRMGALIDDLLAFSRLGRLPVTRSEVNVDSLVREVIEEVVHSTPRGQRKPGTPVPHIELGPLPAAHADRSLLRQVWTNLISNAVKYSSGAAQPRIEVSGVKVGSECRYSVRDNGVGFNMQYVEKLFRVFQRLHRADEFAGTGVGLAIVHRVVTRHGGRVWAQGQVDQGAVFSFALPMGDSSE
ncbi:MAG TPA: ATP-binding protein [Steroidobacteraceae bacterium]|jgi:PAS domain S-box-containing protein|nr:ATP-binding protein [Steroidobacteraceae bacterium]